MNPKTKAFTLVDLLLGMAIVILITSAIPIALYLSQPARSTSSTEHTILTITKCFTVGEKCFIGSDKGPFEIVKTKAGLITFSEMLPGQKYSADFHQTSKIPVILSAKRLETPESE